ncbi:MAG: hypothetical protein JXO22_13920 [Phycisphaerae bacterium]|nr:hypothetical protein [Phycisphaerae bacterium]
MSLTLLAVIAAVAGKAVWDYRQMQDAYLYRQAAAWAADAQLQRYRLGAPIDSRPPAQVVPETITFETKVDAGQGQWQNFNRITVIATANLPNGKQVSERITAYVPSELKPSGLILSSDCNPKEPRALARAAFRSHTPRLLPRETARAKARGSWTCESTSPSSEVTP